MISRSPIRKKRSKPRPGRLQGKDMDALRLACFERDRWRCVVCGRPVSSMLDHEHGFSAHMAHIKGKGMHGDSLSNTRTECGRCHREYHNFGPSRTKPCPKKEHP